MEKMLIAMADIDCLMVETEYKRAYEVVSQYRKEKSDRLKSLKDKQRCIASGILLNQVLRDWNASKSGGTHEGLYRCDLSRAITEYESTYDYEIITVSNGKPVFATHEDIYFNISHAGKYVVCAVADCPIGVDIEGDRTVRENVAKRFFSEEEFCWIKEREDEIESRFFRLWTLKEAYSKLTGEGIALSMSKAHFNMQKEAVLLDECGNARKDTTFFQYKTDDNYFIALASYRVFV